MPCSRWLLSSIWKKNTRYGFFSPAVRRTKHPCRCCLGCRPFQQPELPWITRDILEAERNVDKTKKESRFNASINASVGFNQWRREFGEAYNRPMQQEMVSVSVSIPLVDWGVRKGKYNMARNNLNVVKTSSRQNEISIEEEVIMTVSDFNVQQDLVTSAEEALDLSIRHTMKPANASSSVRRISVALPCH